MYMNTILDETFSRLDLTASQKLAVCVHILACFGAAIGHRPYVDHGQKTYGNLNIVAVGSTGCGKGASYRFTQNLFARVQPDLLAPHTETTSAGSMRQLLREIDNVLSQPTLRGMGEIRIYHVNEEFAGELKSAASTYHSKLPDLLCKLMDGSPISETFGRQRISYPLLHYGFMAHITPALLQSSIRPALITGGCANRLLWFKMPSDAYIPLPSLTEEMQQAVAEDLRQGLAYAAQQRAVPLSQEAITVYNDFCSALGVERASQPGVMADMTARFPMHLLKVALVLTMLRRKAEIDADAISDAIELISTTRATISSYMTPSAQPTPENAVLEHLRATGSQSRVALLHALSQRFTLRNLRDALNELEASGLIYQECREHDGNFPAYYALAN